MKKENIVLTLDDNRKYILVNRVTLDGHDYVHLMDINDATNFMFGEIKDNIIKRITDENLFVKLITIFAEQNK